MHVLSFAFAVHHPDYPVVFGQLASMDFISGFIIVKWRSLYKAAPFVY